VEQPAKETVVLVVTRDEILAEGRRVANVRDVLATTTDTIPALKAELDLLAQRKAVRAENASRIATDGQAVTILADKDIPYSLLRKVMFSCALAGFSDVSFAVRRKDG
jgi:biopolymer transport protein TolR